MTKTTIRIPDPNEPKRFPDGEIAGNGGQNFYFWLGSDDEQGDEATLVGNVDEYEFDFGDDVVST